MTNMRGINIILFAALSGCTWVSKATLDDRAPEFDNDGDGVKAARDCDDNNPERFPGQIETWYDGVDADCALDDDYDFDKDGHVSTAHQGIKTIDVKGTGISPGGDCDDTNNAVNPSASDKWYDGIDSDCRGNDDFDQDDDGYASNAEPYDATQYVSGSGALLAEDCDDERDDVHPGADDQELDGEDSDCAGNDDFDIDNDGHYSDEALFYQATTYAEATTGLAVPGDCDDHDPTMYAYVDADHPGATDDPYDGIDKDCATSTQGVRPPRSPDPAPYRPATAMTILHSTVPAPTPMLLRFCQMPSTTTVTASQTPLARPPSGWSPSLKSPRMKAPSTSASTPCALGKMPRAFT
jgi:hypothetical protein